ncbi:MAG: DUF4954 family protein [Chitinophagaceae bacterium]
MHINHPGTRIKTYPMNQITKQPLSSLGYGFINPLYIPRGKDEYYLRNLQNRSGIRYRNLTAKEIRILESLDNSSDNWQNVRVSDRFDPRLVKRCSFFGLIRIGNLEPLFHEFNNLRMPVGLYHSTIISCDIGHNPVIDNVNFMSHYITGDDVMLVNINELATTDHSKFGNGVVKEGEKESVRIWLELCNENAGRRVLPFNGMEAADAWIWSKYRDNDALLEKFRAFTDAKYDTRRGYYGKIGDRTVIKNCRIIKDTWIGSDAYIKGANKLKNLTINSAPGAKSQIGEGCELVNGIIGYGCRVFYGVKAVRFVMGENSQLKYGARLINSFLGDNSTISCCEVLNSLIFPGHEQHHNNSFLCAATVLGQSNMAAGATIGSNHNSRGADGELIAGRGFWPGLCVSLKHNSRFASFTLIAKGDFPAELNIPIPFSLVSNDVARDRLVVIPAYWLRYNLYALTRNVTKYISRDRRTNKEVILEYEYLAPDSVNEMFEALALMEKTSALAMSRFNKRTIPEKEMASTGRLLLENNPEEANELEILATGFENSTRKVVLKNVPEAYRTFREQILYYGAVELIRFIERNKIRSWAKLRTLLPAATGRTPWKNAGGLLMTEASVQALIRGIRNGRIATWDEVHAFYRKKSRGYEKEKFHHAWSSLLEILHISPSRFTKKIFVQVLEQAIDTRDWMARNIYETRARDYNSPFRQMVYENTLEMENILGKLDDNGFIRQQQEEASAFRDKVNDILQIFER